MNTALNSIKHYSTKGLYTYKLTLFIKKIMKKIQQINV